MGKPKASHPPGLVRPRWCYLIAFAHLTYTPASRSHSCIASAPTSPGCCRTGLPPANTIKFGNALHPVAPGQRLLALGIDLQHHGLARHRLRRLRHLRGRRPARPAPRRPEVHQHRHLRLLHDLVELRRRHRHRLIHRRQRRLARAAPARIRQVPRPNPVPLPATRTRSNHSPPPPPNRSARHLYRCRWTTN